jgi:hypothetical protein
VSKFIILEFGIIFILIFFNENKENEDEELRGFWKFSGPEAKE